MKLIYLTSARIPDDWAHVIQILKMCEAFAQAGNEVELIAPYRGRTLKQDPFDYAQVERIFTIRKLPCIDLFPGTQSGLLYWLRTYSFLFMARLWLSFVRYDLLYTREVTSVALFPDSILELHDFTPAVASRISKLVHSRKVVVITEGLRKQLSSHGFSEDKIVVAADGVDVDDFEDPESKEVARKRLGIALDAKVALYIGILDAWKGVDTLYAAGKLLAPEIETVVIGGFKEEINAIRIANPQIQFLGYKPYHELPANQQAADVLILPNSGKQAISANYTSPLKLFTYMASGVPIVASDLPSIREILDETTAVFVTPDDPEALAEGIRSVLADPEGSRERARRAAEKVQNYTWQKRAEHILATISPTTPAS